MFKKGEVLILTMSENGDTGEYFNLRVVSCEDGLLKVKDPDGKLVVYNMHSRAFVKARRQDD